MRNLLHVLPAGAQSAEEPLRIGEGGIGLGECMESVVVARRAAREALDESDVLVQTVAVLLQSRCGRQAERPCVETVRDEQPVGE